MRMAAVIFLAILVPVTVSSQVLVAKADFNADTIDEAPDPRLPGELEGDYLTTSTQPSGSSYTVVDSLGPLTDKRVRATRVAGPGSFRIGFNFPSTAYTAEKFVIKWCSVAMTAIP